MGIGDEMSDTLYQKLQRAFTNPATKEELQQKLDELGLEAFLTDSGEVDLRPNGPERYSRMEELLESVCTRIKQKLMMRDDSIILEEELLKDPGIGPDLQKCLDYFGYSMGSE